MPDYIYPHELFFAENELAYYLARLAKSKCQAVPWNTEGLLHKQPEAVVNACTSSISILTGPPGTGKTTTLRMIIKSFIKAGLRGIIICPTGKAAKRADEVVNADLNFTEKINCMTAHTGLQYDGMIGGFVFNRTNKWKYDFVIMDEFSMADTIIARDFLEAVDPKKTRVVFSGDQYQLPSVGAGNLARDMIASGVFKTTELDVVLRTGANSGITCNANKILRGQDITKIDPSSGEEFKDFFFVPRPDEQITANSIVKWITEDIPEKRGYNNTTDIQLMCPGKRSVTGTVNMNKVLRDILNTHKAGTKLKGFSKGDKVINGKNTKQLYLVNGDIGYVKEVISGQSGSHLVLDMGPNTGPKLDGIVEMKGDMINQLQLAYALTVHKCQGSEFPVGILPLHKAHSILLTRNLVYTGLTRSKALGMLVGDPSALKYSIHNNSSEHRVTNLVSRIKFEYARKAA